MTEHKPFPHAAAGCPMCQPTPREVDAPPKERSPQEVAADISDRLAWMREALSDDSPEAHAIDTVRAFADDGGE